jgi:hypothetical protein
MSESSEQSRTMTGTGVPGSWQPSAADVVPPPAPPPSAWTGWVTFAGIALTLVGVLHLVEGLVALAEPDHYAVSPRGLVLHWNYTTWGWIHLIGGVVLIVAGVGVLNRNKAARIVGVAAAGLSALVNLTFVSAAPVYALTVIALDVVFIYAICVHGGQVPVNRGSERSTGFTGPGAP